MSKDIKAFVDKAGKTFEKGEWPLRPAARAIDTFIVLLVEVPLGFVGIFYSISLLEGSFSQVISDSGGPIELYDPVLGALLGLEILIRPFYFMILASFFRGTPGKHLLGLNMIDREGKFPDFHRLVIGEIFLLFFHFIFIPLTVVWAFFDKDKLTLHERMSGTKVVRSRSKIKFVRDFREYRKGRTEKR